LARQPRCLISLSGLFGLPANQLYQHRWLIDSLAVLRTSCHSINEATEITWQLKQAAALGVATLRSSATETAALTYYFTTSSLHMQSLVREKMWWWLALARKKMWLWIASFGKSYNGDVLQLAEKIFSLSLPQMTKYCVMRECENIHSWISLIGDLVFSHQGEIYGFKFPKRFLGDLFQRSHSFISFDSFLDLII